MGQRLGPRVLAVHARPCLAANAERGEADVTTLVPVHVLEEVVDDRDRDDETDVLGALERLESDADHLAVEDRRAA